MGLEVELVRQQNLVDVTAGIVNFGLDRRWTCALSAMSRATGSGAWWAGSVLGELRHRPASLTGVFVSPGTRACNANRTRDRFGR